MVLGGKGIEILEREATPWRAQNGHPRYAIRRVQKREGEGHQILDDLPLAELIDFNGLERNAMALQCCNDFDQMASGSNQDSGAPVARRQK